MKDDVSYLEQDKVFNNRLILVEPKLLAGLIKARYVSYVEFCDRVGLHKSTLSRVLQGKELLRFIHAKKIVIELSNGKEEAIELWIKLFGNPSL